VEDGCDNPGSGVLVSCSGTVTGNHAEIRHTTSDDVVNGVTGGDTCTGPGSRAQQEIYKLANARPFPRPAWKVSSPTLINPCIISRVSSRRQS